MYPTVAACLPTALPTRLQILSECIRVRQVAYFRIRQDTSGYVRIRQDTSEILACLANEVADFLVAHAKLSAAVEDLPRF